MKKSLLTAFSAIIIQFAVVMMVYGSALVPHLTGTQVTLEVTPRDPRSVFRGNYARLRLNEHSLPVSSERSRICPYDTVYVPLEKNGKYYRGKGGQLKKPTEGLYLRGRVELKRCVNAGRSVPIQYGLEAYFAPKLEAEAIDRKARFGGFELDVMVAPGGQAAIKDIRIKEQS